MHMRVEGISKRCYWTWYGSSSKGRGCSLCFTEKGSKEWNKRTIHEDETLTSPKWFSFCLKPLIKMGAECVGGSTSDHCVSRYPGRVAGCFYLSWAHPPKKVTGLPSFIAGPAYGWLDILSMPSHSTSMETPRLGKDAWSICKDSFYLCHISYERNRYSIHVLNSCLPSQTVPGWMRTGMSTMGSYTCA